MEKKAYPHAGTWERLCSAPPGSELWALRVSTLSRALAGDGSPYHNTWADGCSPQSLLRAPAHLVPPGSTASPGVGQCPPPDTGAAACALPAMGGERRVGRPQSQPSPPMALARLASSGKTDQLNRRPMIFPGDEDVVTSDCLFLWPSAGSAKPHQPQTPTRGAQTRGMACRKGTT